MNILNSTWNTYIKKRWEDKEIKIGSNWSPREKKNKAEIIF